MAVIVANNFSLQNSRFCRYRSLEFCP